MVYIIVAVCQATNSGGAGRWRSPDRQRVPIEVRQFWDVPLLMRLFFRTFFKHFYVQV